MDAFTQFQLEAMADRPTSLDPSGAFGPALAADVSLNRVKLSYSWFENGSRL
jgi:hypothetical protein